MIKHVFGFSFTLALALAACTQNGAGTSTGSEPVTAARSCAEVGGLSATGDEGSGSGSGADSCDACPGDASCEENDCLCDDDDSAPAADGTCKEGKAIVCHIPPGNYNARHTITIDASAWPAHQGHCAQGTCDYIGSCK